MDEWFKAGKFVAPWGEDMIVEEGDLLAVPHPKGGEVYRIEQKAFAQTYMRDHEYK